MEEPVEHSFLDFIREFGMGMQYAFFELPEQRAQIGRRGSIIFEVRPKENGHNEPHIHAEYQGKNISISLNTFEVLAGNLPPKLQKTAIEWTKQHFEQCKSKWYEYHRYKVTVM